MPDGSALHACRSAHRARRLPAPLRARGVTAFYEGHGVAPELLSVYREAHERGSVAAPRVPHVSPTWDAADAGRAIPEVAAWGRRPGLGDDRLRVAASVSTTAAIPTWHASSTPRSPTRAGPASSRAPTRLEAYREQAELGRPGTAAHQHAGHAEPRPGSRRGGRRSLRVRDRRSSMGGVHLERGDRRPARALKRSAAAATTNPISYLWRSAAEEARKLGGGAETLLLIAVSSACVCPSGSPPTTSRPTPGWPFRAVVDRSDMASGEVLGPRERLTRLAALRALTVAAPSSRSPIGSAACSRRTSGRSRCPRPGSTHHAAGRDRPRWPAAHDGRWPRRARRSVGEDDDGLHGPA